MDDDEVVLHALDVLPELGHKLVVSSAMAKALALQEIGSVGEPSTLRAAGGVWSEMHQVQY